MEFVCSFQFSEVSQLRRNRQIQRNEYFPGCFIILFPMLEFYKHIKSPITILRSRKDESGIWSGLVLSYSLLIWTICFFIFLFSAEGCSLSKKFSAPTKKYLYMIFGHILFQEKKTSLLLFNIIVILLVIFIQL